jgi:hypothetical protein
MLGKQNQDKSVMDSLPRLSIVYEITGLLTGLQLRVLAMLANLAELATYHLIF